MMNVNPLYQKEILEHQAGYIRMVQKSAYVKLARLFMRLPDLNNGKVSLESLADNQKIIKRLNDIRIRRWGQAHKLQLGKTRYLKNHPEVMKRIREIKRDNSDKVYLSIACIMKNEGAYLHEWLEFHIAAGVDRFYLFDNDSEDNTYEILKPYIENRTVVYIRFPGKTVQLHAYNIACDLCKGTSRWLALIDADEFLHPVQARDLKSVIKEYEAFPAIGVNWVVYGTCGQKAPPEGLICDNYRLTFANKDNELNCRIKSIVNPNMVMAVMSPHHCWYKNGKYAVDENKEKIIGEAIYAKNSSMSCTMFNHRAILRINHYWTKSEAELQAKCNRGYPDGHPNPEFKQILNRLDYPLVEDTETFIPFVKNLK